MRNLALLCVFAACVAAQSAAPVNPAASAQAPAVKPQDPLQQFSASLETLARHVHPAVVQIFSSGYRLTDENADGNNAAVVTRQKATGSGIILSADGYIVTNAHVVANARRVRVRIAGETPGGGDAAHAALRQDAGSPRGGDGPRHRPGGGPNGSQRPLPPCRWAIPTRSARANW